METLPAPQPPVKPPCTEPDCDRPAKARGLCNTHYMRLLRHGDPTVTLPAGRPALSDADRQAAWEEEAKYLWPDPSEAEQALKRLKLVGLKATRLLTQGVKRHRRDDGEAFGTTDAVGSTPFHNPSVPVEEAKVLAEYAATLTDLMNHWFPEGEWEAVPQGTGVDPLCRCDTCKAGTAGQADRENLGPDTPAAQYWRDRSDTYHEGRPTSGDWKYTDRWDSK